MLHFWVFLHDLRNESGMYVHFRKGSWFVDNLFNAEGLWVFPSQIFVAIDHFCLCVCVHLLRIYTHFIAV